jgi:hydroxyacyl-ACP dehydratase HTD2-like protein with hotdog domain
MRNALAEEPNKTPAHFRFRGLAPVFAENRFCIHNESMEKSLTLQLTKQDDIAAMKAEVEWRQ